ncbi:hypothetical protein BGX26_002102, partial [Mortierella sp. AD094]
MEPDNPSTSLLLCEDCDRTFNTYRDLLLHRSRHPRLPGARGGHATTITIYICGSGDCAQEYDTVEQIQVHVKSTPGHHYLVCPDPVCGEILFTEYSLIRHGAFFHPPLPPPPEPIPGKEGVYKFVTNYIGPMKNPYEPTPITVELAFKRGPKVQVVGHGVMDGDTPLLLRCFGDGSKLPHRTITNFPKVVAAQGIIYSTLRNGPKGYCTGCKKRLDWTICGLGLNEDLQRLHQKHLAETEGLIAAFGTRNVNELVVRLKKTVPAGWVCRKCSQDITKENPHWVLDKIEGVILSKICKGCIFKRQRDDREQRLQTLNGYRTTWVSNHGEHFSSHALAERFINGLLVQQWSFGHPDFTEEEYLKVMQDVDVIPKTCMFHHVTLYPGHKDVRFMISVDRTQFWWMESKTDGFQIGKWVAYDYSDPRQLSVLSSLADNIMQGARPLLERLRFVVWLSESFVEGRHWAEKKRETWKLLLPYLDRILELEKKRPIGLGIRRTFNERKRKAELRKKQFTRSWITGAHLDGSIEVGHMDRQFDDDGYEARNVMFVEAGLNLVKLRMGFKQRTTQDRKASIDLVAKDLTNFADWWIDSMVPEAFLMLFEIYKSQCKGPSLRDKAQHSTQNHDKSSRESAEDKQFEDVLLDYVEEDDEVELRRLVEKLRRVQQDKETDRKDIRLNEARKDPGAMTIFDVDLESLPASARTVLEQERVAAISKDRSNSMGDSTNPESSTEAMVKPKRKEPGIVILR